MIPLDDVLAQIQPAIDRPTINQYIIRAWVRPILRDDTWYFEDIDITRVKLVHHLRSDMQVGDDAMDIMLHLLDQLYHARERMRLMHEAMRRQPDEIQDSIRQLMQELALD